MAAKMAAVDAATYSCWILLRSDYNAANTRTNCFVFIIFTEINDHKARIDVENYIETSLSQTLRANTSMTQQLLFFFKMLNA